MDDEILTNEQLQKLLFTTKYKMDAVNNELSEIDINNIELDDLIDYKNKLNNTITLAEDLKYCFEFLSLIAECYFRIKKDADKQAIEIINNEIESYDFKHLTEFYYDKKLSLNPYVHAIYLDERKKNN